MVPNWRLVPGPGWNRTGSMATGFTPSKIRTALNPWFFGWFHKFINSELWLQLSIWVLIVSQYNIYLKDAVLDAVSPRSLQFAFRSLFGELLGKNGRIYLLFEATQRLVTGSHIGEWVAQEHVKLHLLCIYYIVIWLELKCLIGAKVLSSRK
jgi:hypothetical protein